jgi:hypothetical protein
MAIDLMVRIKANRVSMFELMECLGYTDKVQFLQEWKRLTESERFALKVEYVKGGMYVS